MSSTQGLPPTLPLAFGSNKNGTGSKFCKRYNCDKLVFAEIHERIEEAGAREKAIKAWPRLWKLQMIQAANPNWDDLYEALTL